MQNLQNYTMGMNNRNMKWYIVGGIILTVILVLLLTRKSSKTYTKTHWTYEDGYKDGECHWNHQCGGYQCYKGEGDPLDLQGNLGTCRDSCDMTKNDFYSNPDCDINYKCFAGQCKRPNRTRCDADEECASNVCDRIRGGNRRICKGNTRDQCIWNEDCVSNNCIGSETIQGSERGMCE